jgi:glycosyltransferase involved in cell wall biosynthesis
MVMPTRLCVSTHLTRWFDTAVQSFYLISNTDIVFGIMGKYWWDQWKYSKYAHWQKKMIRLDMAVDINKYCKIKNQFNQKNKRKFLYIGRNDSMKGTDFLSCLAKSCPEYEFGWIGSGNQIEGVNKISDFVELTNEFMKKIAIEYDFFISPSRADPNPTTILETMAWGFPVLCTVQSGYYEDEVITNIFLDDIEKTKSVLKKFQEMEECELITISNNSRKKISNSYNWNVFTEKIKSNISSIYYS